MDADPLAADRRHARPAPGRAAHARAVRVPPARVALAHDGRAAGLDLEAAWVHGRHARAVGGRRRGVADLPDPPVGRLVREPQVRQPALEQPRLGLGRVVERRVRKRDPAHRRVLQPAVVALRRQRPAVVEERVGLLVELALPAARQRHAGREVGGLPVVVRERHLDALAWPHGIVEERARVGEERLLGRRVAVRLGHGAHGGQPLQVHERDQHGGDGEARGAGARGQQQQRRPEEHGQAQRVLAEHVRDRERRDQHDEVEDHAGPQRPPAGRQQRRADHRHRQHRPEGGGHEAVVAALREQHRHRRAADGHRQHQRRREPERLAAAAGRPRRRCERQEGAGDRTGQHAGERQHGGQHAPGDRGPRSRTARPPPRARCRA